MSFHVVMEKTPPSQQAVTKALVTRSVNHAMRTDCRRATSVLFGWVALCGLATLGLGNQAWASEKNVHFHEKLSANQLTARPIVVQFAVPPRDGSPRAHTIIPKNAPPKLQEQAKNLATRLGHKVIMVEHAAGAPRLPAETLDRLGTSMVMHRERFGPGIDVGKILASGLGTRFGGLVTATTKEMVPIYDAPLLQHSMDLFARGGASTSMVSYRWGSNGESVVRHFSDQGNTELDASLQSKLDLYAAVQHGKHATNMIFVPQLGESAVTAPHKADPYGPGIPTGVALPILKQLHETGLLHILGLTYADDLVAEDHKALRAGAKPAAQQIHDALVQAQTTFPKLRIAAANGVKLIPLDPAAESFGIAVPDKQHRGELIGGKPGEPFFMMATKIEEKPTVQEMRDLGFAVNPKFLGATTAQDSKPMVAGSYGLFAVDMGKLISGYDGLKKGKGGEFWFMDAVNGATTAEGRIVAVQPQNTLWLPTGSPDTYLRAHITASLLWGQLTPQDLASMEAEAASVGR